MLPLCCGWHELKVLADWGDTQVRPAPWSRKDIQVAGYDPDERTGKP
jgi:hypothetical protein